MSNPINYITTLHDTQAEFLFFLFGGMNTLYGIILFLTTCSNTLESELHGVLVYIIMIITILVGEGAGEFFLFYDRQSIILG